MARMLRVEGAGLWYHITARGNERRAIYRGDADRRHFLELLARGRERFRCRLHAYVLMENHYHLLLETPEPNLSRAVQWLNLSYSVWFNLRHRRCGHLFQGRFKAVVVDPQEWALELSRYIHLNPVRVAALKLDKQTRQRSQQGLGEMPLPEMVKDRLGLLKQFPWSSYRAYAGYDTPPAWLDCETVLSLGGGRDSERRRHYREDCQKAVCEGIQISSPWKGVVGQLVLGGAEFVENLRRKEWQSSVKIEVSRALAERPGWNQIVRAVERIKGERWDEFRDRRGDWGRDLALCLGRELGGMKLAALRQAVGAGSAMAVSVAVKRFGVRLKQEKELRELVKKAEAEMFNV